MYFDDKQLYLRPRAENKLPKWSSPTNLPFPFFIVTFSGSLSGFKKVGYREIRRYDLEEVVAAFVV